MGTGNSINANTTGIIGYNGSGTFTGTSATNHAVLVGGASSSTITNLSVGSNGQLLIGSTAADPAFASLTSSDSSITFTTGANTLSLQVSGGTTVGKTITGDSGGALSPTAGNWNLLGSGSITTVGSGSTITTQLTGLTNHNLLIGAGTSTITNLAPSATSGVALISQGASADPAFGTVVVAGGGTGAATLTGILIGNGTSAVTGNAVTNHNVLIGGASNAVTSVAPSATTGIPLVSQGAAADPAFSTAVVAGGGTGAVTLTGILTGNGTSAVTANTVTQHGVLIGGASNAASSLGVASTGTVLAGATGADPAFTATPSVTSITLSSGTALSAYVQGTFTPVLAFGGASTGITYSTQSGKYTQIGNIVYFSINVALTSKGSSSGGATITGLPVASAGTALPSGTIEMQTAITFTALYTFAGFNVSTSPTQINLLQYGSGQSETSLADTSFTNTSSFRLTGFYFTA